MNEIAKQEVTDIKHDRIQSIINHRYDKVRIPWLTLWWECDITPIIFWANSSWRSPQWTYSAVLDERHNWREEDEFMNFFMNFTEDKAYISKNADLDISINWSRIKECEVTSELRN